MNTKKGTTMGRATQETRRLLLLATSGLQLESKILATVKKSYYRRTKVRHTAFTSTYVVVPPLFPLRLLHKIPKALRPEHYCSINLFRGINYSATLAT